MPLRDFDNVTNALNFDTADCHVIGGCDLYTTKAAGADKKLYRAIEKELEQQYQTLIKVSAAATKSRKHSEVPTVNLSRSSPFGSLSQTSSRRTFAYLIATLNASHPDYDFSHLLRPSDFRREKNLRYVMTSLDTTLYNLRPRPTSNDVGSYWSSSAASSAPANLSASSDIWNPRKWRMIDKEMNLRECNIYVYAPEEDPYDGDEGAIWSFNYFFFNKARKRVCYIYLKGLSIISHSPSQKFAITMKRSADVGWIGSEPGSSKRAKYWLGNRENVSGGWDDDDDDDDYGYGNAKWDDEGVDVPEEQILDDGDEPIYVPLAEETEPSPIMSASSGRSTNSRSRSKDSSSGLSKKRRSSSKSTVRGISEDILETMEV